MYIKNPCLRYLVLTHLLDRIPSLSRTFAHTISLPKTLFPLIFLMTDSFCMSQITFNLKEVSLTSLSKAACSHCQSFALTLPCSSWNLASPHFPSSTCSLSSCLSTTLQCQLHGTWFFLSISVWHKVDTQHIWVRLYLKYIGWIIWKE